MEGFDALSAADCRDALDVVRGWTPQLVICDLNLPDGTALEVLEGYRSRGLSTPFIIITGWGTVSSALEAGRLGVIAYLEKPISSDDLLELVRTQFAKILAVNEAPSGYAARAKLVMERRYAEIGLDVRGVASSVGVSPQYLCRLLKQQFGVTFANLLRNIRITEARRLIREQSCPLKEVAFRVGFRRASQFTRVFREQCGISPSQYRRQPPSVAAGRAAV
jgi:YesN/AraC family two-component response regulator